MESRIFLELQATVRCNKRTISGEGLWSIGPDRSLLIGLANNIAAAFMVAAAEKLETLEFRIELVLTTLVLSGPHAEACFQACQLLAEDDPRRVTWTEGRKRYDRKGVSVG
jgi:hypothetical protein